MKTSTRLWLAFILTVGVIAGSADRARAVVIGGWDLARGGVDSLADNPDLAPFRALIESIIPSATFSGTPVLTDAYLSTVNGYLFLGTATSNNTAITSLTSAEQTALYQFVLDGGAVFIATDNIHQSINTVAVYASILGPFGLHEIGDSFTEFPGNEGATVVNQTHPITNGPFGSLSNFPTNRYGWYDDLGPYASPLAVGTYNNQPLLAVIDRGVLGPGSGPVVFQSDLNIFDFTFSNPDTLHLVENATSFLYVPEPSTWVLIATGFFGVLLCARRRHRINRRVTQ